MLSERRGCLSALGFLQKPLALLCRQTNSEARSLQTQGRETIGGEREDLLRDKLRDVLQEKYSQFEELYENAYELYYLFPESIDDELSGRVKLQREQLFNKLLDEGQLPRSTVMAMVSFLCYSSCAEIAKDSRFQARTVSDGCQGLEKDEVYTLIRNRISQISNFSKE